MKCTKCGYDIYEGAVCPLCGYDNSGKAAASEISETVTDEYGENGESEISIETTPPPMKWYKALKIILWFNIITNLVSGYMYATGSIYDGMKDAVYSAIPSLQTLDMFCTLFSVAFAIFIFIVWYNLNEHNARGPKLLTVLYILNIAFLVFYSSALSAIISGAESTTIYGSTYTSGMYVYQSYVDLSALAKQSPSNIISIISNVVFIFVNKIYFKNREQFFY